VSIRGCVHEVWISDVVHTLLAGRITSLRRLCEAQGRWLP
jgi:hypothetical protein